MSHKRIAIFPGSFNPFTIGHESIVRRALPLFDSIIIAIGINESKSNQTSKESIIKNINSIFVNEPTITCQSYSGLTTEFAQSVGARFILRGVRSIADFEYECRLADVNRDISGIETIFMPSLPELSFVSASMVRELQHFGHDVSKYLPQSTTEE
jgi:pantetheine-phosphate adenylyltransferase